MFYVRVHFCITCESALKDYNVISTEIYLVLLLLDLSNKIKGGGLSMEAAQNCRLCFLSLSNDFEGAVGVLGCYALWLENRAAAFSGR